MIEKELIEIFLEATAIDGLSGNEKDVAGFIKNYLITLGLYPYEDKSAVNTNSNTGNIICKINGGGDFLVSCHMDTARSTKDVRPILNTDRITSAGNTVLGVDNRIGVAILLYLAKKIVVEKINTKGFTLVFVTCEETTLGGSEFLEIDSSIKRGFVFDSQYRPGRFINSSYGAVGFKVEILGKSSHSGISPEKGINAFQIMLYALSGEKFGRLKPELTFNIGKVDGGTATNVVMDNLILEGEIRSTDLKEVENKITELEQKFENAASNLGGKIIFEWKWDFTPFMVEKNSTAYKMISEAISKTGLIPEAVISAGGSDANSYNLRGVESVNIGIGAQNPHSNDEFILLEDFKNAFSIALELVKE